MLAPRPLRLLLDAALPPRCAACGTVVADTGGLCVDCFAALTPIGPPWCALCNLPTPEAIDPEAVCEPCRLHPPRHAGIRAACAYGDVSAALAVKLKHGGRIGIARLMGRLLARQVSDQAPLLVPVPLHRWRIWARGYNQSALIARAVAAERGGQVVVDALLRTRRTPSLGGLGRAARAKALKGAVTPGPGIAAVAGRPVWLVDDVYTSGATADACVRALRRGGAGPVTVLAFARVLHEAGE